MEAKGKSGGGAPGRGTSTAINKKSFLSHLMFHPERYISNTDASVFFLSVLTWYTYLYVQWYNPCNQVLIFFI